MTVVAKSGLGWTITDDKYVAKRVGPHNASSDNPREITFRNEATADLLSGMMWLIHTGCAGETMDIYVYQWHGLRPLGAKFGSDDSDHKAGVAFDANWAEHPWETAVGSAVYDQHMRSRTHLQDHATFRACVKKLTPPGQRTLVRWCGEEWSNPKGVGYFKSYSNRDCMHFVIETPDWDRINSAAKWLRSWFNPPRTKDDILSWQSRINLSAKEIGLTKPLAFDGQFGPASVRGMRLLQKHLSVPATGLPGDVKTWRAWKASVGQSSPAPKPQPKPSNPFGISDVRGLQKISRANGGKTAVDNDWGPESAKGFAHFLRVLYGYRDTNNILGPNMWAAIAKWLRHRWGYVGNDIPGPNMRAALKRANTANFNAL